MICQIVEYVQVDQNVYFFASASLAALAEPFKEALMPRLSDAAWISCDSPRWSALKFCIVEAVEQEVGQIRYDCFGTFGFEQIYKIVVGSWKEFNKDLSNNTDTWLFDICQWQD